MSQYLFIAIFVIFSAVEVYIAVRLIKNKTFNLMSDIMVGYIGFSLFLLMDYLFKLLVPDYILILVIITIIVHTYFGNYLNYYKKSKHFDRYLHAFGSFSFSLFVYSVISKTTNPVMIPKVYGALFVVSLGLSLGVVFEILEFLIDSFKKTKHQKGLIDTDFDLIFNVIGSVIAGIFAVTMNIV